MKGHYIGQLGYALETLVCVDESRYETLHHVVPGVFLGALEEGA